MIQLRPPACVLNRGPAAWAFAPLAQQLADALGVEVSETPRAYNYLLGSEQAALPAPSALFVPPAAIELAADKRALARVFSAAGVPTPETHLFEEEAAARAFVASSAREWCLKYPTGTGALGHRLFGADTPIPEAWPVPYIVQEFIRLPTPEVYRGFAAGGELFGWLVRRYAGGGGSPWVAHARGAHWGNLGPMPADAAGPVAAALEATGLIGSFGCVDLIRRPTGGWVVLEVGTDGLHSHVDRDLGDSAFEAELLERIAGAFWRWVAASEVT